MALHVIDAVRAECPDLVLGVIDVAEAPAAAVRYGVTATPAIVIDGRLALTGVPAAETLKAWLLTQRT